MTTSTGQSLPHHPPTTARDDPGLPVTFASYRSDSFSSALSSSPVRSDDDVFGITSQLLEEEELTTWPTSALGLENLGDQDPYGTRHLESAGVIYTPSFHFLLDNQPSSAMASSSSASAAFDPTHLGLRPPFRSSISLPPTLAFHAFHKSPTSIWLPKDGGFEEFTPPPNSFLPLPSPCDTTHSDSPLRNRFLPLDLTLASEGLHSSIDPPSSLPMSRSETLPASRKSPMEFNKPYARTDRPASSKGKAGVLALEGPGKLIKVYKGGKAMHSCEGCRKKRAKVRSLACVSLVGASLTLGVAVPFQCTGGQPPPAGQAGLSIKPCDRCTSQDMECFYDVLKVRGPCGKYKALASRAIGGSETASSSSRSHRRARSLVEVSPPKAPSLSSSPAPFGSTNLPSMHDPRDENFDPFGQPTPSKPGLAKHTFIPDPHHYNSSGTSNATTPNLFSNFNFQTSASYRLLHPPIATSQVDPHDRFHPMSTRPVAPQNLRSHSDMSVFSFEDDDHFPISPPAPQAPFSVNSGAQQCYPHPSQPTVSLLQDPISASMHTAPSADNNPVHHLSAFTKSSSYGWSAQDEVPFVAPSIWQWFGRSDEPDDPRP